MDRDEIRRRVKETVARVTELDPASIADDASFVEQLGLDSLALIEIAVHVDHAWQLKLTDDEMKGMGTVDGAVELVVRKMAEKGASAPRA